MLDGDPDQGRVATPDKATVETRYKGKKSLQLALDLDLRRTEDMALGRNDHEYAEAETYESFLPHERTQWHHAAWS